MHTMHIHHAVAVTMLSSSLVACAGETPPGAPVGGPAPATVGEHAASEAFVSAGENDALTHQFDVLSPLAAPRLAADADVSPDLAGWSEHALFPAGEDLGRCRVEIFAPLNGYFDEEVGLYTLDLSYDDRCLGGPLEGGLDIVESHVNDEAAWGYFDGTFFVAATEASVRVDGMYKFYFPDASQAAIELTIYDDAGVRLANVSGTALWDGQNFTKLDAVATY